MSVMTEAASAVPIAATGSHKPLRIGFLGTGWIGRHRMGALMEAQALDAVLCDPSPQELDEARALVPGAETADSLAALLECDLDGLVIATPSALHAEQAIAALERDIAVFCQKPLGRSAAEVERILAAARQSDRLLGVDMSYRHTRAAQAVRDLVQEGALGRVHSVDLTFHNAYGPDKPWFYDPQRAGGGCLIDLGVHLVDLALWTLDFPGVDRVHAALKHEGAPLRDRASQCEDMALATLGLADGTTVRIACSWKLHAGQDAVISAAFHGTQGSGVIRNVEGSFYDFVAEHMRGTQCARLIDPPDDWGGRAVAAWGARLAQSRGFDPAVAEQVLLARTIDRIYAAHSASIPGGVDADRHTAEKPDL